jgi:small subunit ribosomal protein S18
MARQTNRKKPKKGADLRPAKKKTSLLTLESVDYVDYKDVNLLRRFMSERAKIRARRVTGNDRQQQQAVSKAIKVAREMALLPYSVRQVTQRKGGRRGDRRRERPDERTELGEDMGVMGEEMEVEAVDELDAQALEAGEAEGAEAASTEADLEMEGEQ